MKIYEIMKRVRDAKDRTYHPSYMRNISQIAIAIAVDGSSAQLAWDDLRKDFQPYSNADMNDPKNLGSPRELALSNMGYWLTNDRPVSNAAIAAGLSSLSYLNSKLPYAHQNEILSLIGDIEKETGA